MSRLSMRWMVVTTVGMIASNATAQGWEDSPTPPAENKADAPATSLKDTKKASSDSGISVDASASTNAPAPNANANAAAASTPGETVAPAAAGAAAGAAPDAMPVSDDGKPWMEQLLPTDGLIEIGAAVGLLFPSKVLNLQSQTAKHQHLSTAPELGVRFAYFPIKYVGGELEYMVGFTKTDKDNQSANTWAMRGQLIGQLPFWRITPFAVLGGGRLGVISNTMGSDGDPAFHFGVGAKAAITDSLLARFDIRDNMAQKHGASDGTLCNSFEVLLGVSLTLGRPQPPPAKVVDDTDGDGFVDRIDKCPREPGVAPDGCPLKDSDGDGIMDNDDKCPTEMGVAPDGCPIRDSDGDGVPDSKDKCLNEKGEPPDGCPTTRDSDGDGIIDSKDKCPNAAETKNGFEDDDGCPDELPARVKDFTGVIQGIEFDQNKATIRASSSTTLDKSAGVLAEYPSLRVLITGHTDNTGIRERNVQLSKDRAESVKAYMVGKGIDSTRIETKGAGPDEPIDSNVTAVGRQRNRRIEFKLIKDSD